MLGKEDSVNENHLSPDCAALASAAVPIIIPTKGGKRLSLIHIYEATASLDPENEVLVQKAIAQLVENKTVIMIAHRLRTVVDADQILVLDDGKLVEYGTHNELMKKKGVYQKLYHIQQESLGWTI